VELHGRVVAGGLIGDTGIDWLGPDSTITVTAGEQILVDTVLAAAKSVSLTTTTAVSADDGGYAVVIGSAAGLTAAGITSDDSGGLVNVHAVGSVTISGSILSGGRMNQVFDSHGQLQSETIAWSLEASTIHVESAGQLYLGGMVPNQAGTLVEIGGTLRASQNIELIGGSNSDGIGVRMPGGARIATSNEDGSIYIRAAQDAEINGQLVAGGEVLDHYDSVGSYLGSTLRTFNGDSSIVILADRQIHLGRNLYAGKTIDVRGGYSTKLATPSEYWLDDGIFLDGNVHLQTWQEYSSITLSASGDLSVLPPAWTKEIVADDFAEFADGHISGASSFLLTVNLGTHTVQGTVTLAAGATSGNNGLGFLKDDLQAAIAATAFEVIASPDGPAVGSTVHLNTTQVEVGLSDGHLMLRGNYALTLASVADGHAERLGFTQLAAGTVLSTRTYAIDAPQRGSTVNIGKADAPGGEITIAGWIRGYQAINLYAGNDAAGNQSVSLKATGQLETLDGGMVLNPAGHTVLEGNLVARGHNASIVINAKDTLELRGDLIAQHDILINAGTVVNHGEVSIETYGTSQLVALDAGGRIIISGLNDVIINSSVGKVDQNGDGVSEGPSLLGLVKIGSESGNLLLGSSDPLVANSSWLETGTMMSLYGQTVELSGVVKSYAATDPSYDWEINVASKGDVLFHGDIRVAGSVWLDAADDIDIYNSVLLVQGAAQCLKLTAVDAVNLGNVAGHSGGATLEAASLLDIKAGGQVNVGDSAKLYSAESNSLIHIQSASLNLAGSIQAGKHYDLASNSDAWTGHGADVQIKTTGEVILGNASFGGSIWTSGGIDIQSGSSLLGLGFSMTKGSFLKVDATGAGTWGEAVAGEDGLISLQSSGDIQIHGAITGMDVGSDIAIASRGQILIDSLIRTDDQLSVTGGTDVTRIGIYVTVLDLVNQAGGTLDTAAGGAITLFAADSIKIEGVVGEQDLGQGKVGKLTVTSGSGDISVLRNINVRDQLEMHAANIYVLSGSYIYATGTDSDLFLQARGQILVAGKDTVPNPDIPEAIIKADRLIHLLASSITMADSTTAWAYPTAASCSTPAAVSPSRACCSPMTAST
jgi:hypothetical protein